MLQVAVIQIIFLLLQGEKALVHFLRQRKQRPKRGQGVAQIGLRPRLVLGQQIAGELHPLFPFLPQGLKPPRSFPARASRSNCSVSA